MVSFWEINNTVEKVKKIAANSNGKCFTYSEITRIITINEWRHMIVVMKILQHSESVPNTDSIECFNKKFCVDVFNNSMEAQNASIMPECFSVLLTQVGKVSKLIIHLAALCYDKYASACADWTEFLDKLTINKHFYYNYEPTLYADWQVIVQRSDHTSIMGYVRKYAQQPNGLILLDNALIVDTLITDFDDHYISCGTGRRIVEAIQKRIIKYAERKNLNVWHTISQHSETYNNVANSIVYTTQWYSLAKNLLTLLDEQIINNILDSDSLIHDKVFSYPTSMRVSALLSFGFGAENKLVERAANIMKENGKIIKKYFSNTTKIEKTELNYGKYLMTVSEDNNTFMRPKNNSSIIVISRNRQLQAATKYLSLIMLDEQLKQFFDPITAAKILTVFATRIDSVIERYYSNMTNIILDEDKDSNNNNNEYDGRVCWDTVEPKAQTHLNAILNTTEESMGMLKCTVDDYPPLVRLAVSYYYSRMAIGLNKLEEKLTNNPSRTDYEKNLFGNVTVDRFEHELEAKIKQIVVNSIKNTTKIEDNMAEIVKEWEHYSLCRYSLKSDYVAETINKIC